MLNEKIFVTMVVVMAALGMIAIYLTYTEIGYYKKQQTADQEEGYKIIAEIYYKLDKIGTNVNKSVDNSDATYKIVNEYLLNQTIK